jgi:muramoyltetrapeptide carboxypeptidase LdcA involved in peptidoglycan recycling
LTQLEVSGKLRAVKGIILGHLATNPDRATEVSEGGRGPIRVLAGEEGAAPAGASPVTAGRRVAEADGDPDLWQRLRERSTTGAARRIVAWNLPGGHGRPNLTLPLGAFARLDPEAGALVIRDDAPGAPA